MHLYGIKKAPLLIAMTIILSLITISSVEGQPLIQRSPLGGLYAQGTAPPPDDNLSADVLVPLGNLIDGNLQASTGIGLSTAGNPGDKYQNIGISVSSSNYTDFLFLYVNRDVSAESRLGNANNWLFFKSNFNQANTWTEVPVKQVAIDINTVDDEYRYEIEFSSPQNASFFKAVNLEMSSVIGVEVTEIEAYGIVPEPISYILFVTGGGMLAIRRLFKRNTG